MVIEKLQHLAERKGHSIATVATAWLLQKGACPIIGLATDHRIERVSEAFAVQLELDDLHALEQHYRPIEMIAM